MVETHPNTRIPSVDGWEEDGGSTQRRCEVEDKWMEHAQEQCNGALGERIGWRTKVDRPLPSPNQAWNGWMEESPQVHVHDGSEAA